MLTITSASGTTICGSSSRGVTSSAASPISTETTIRMIEKLLSRKRWTMPLRKSCCFGSPVGGPFLAGS